MEANSGIIPARKQDLGRIMEIFEAAKRFMRTNGNNTQWDGAYPEKELILNEIDARHCYVVLNTKGAIIGTFCFIIGADPTYASIEDGAWLNDAPYGTIHRLASDGTDNGVGHRCIEFCASIIGNLRAETHNDNIPMQNLLAKEGFMHCGIIYLKDGSPRIAYQRADEIKSGLQKLVCPRFINEEKYRKGHISIINALAGTHILGVHIPGIKAFAKSIIKSGKTAEVLDGFELQAKNSVRNDAADILCYEEKLLWGLLIGSIKDNDERLRRTSNFVPLIANWAECDTFCCNAKFKEKDKAGLSDFLLPYFNSGREFEVRYATIMSMCNFLDTEHLEETFRRISTIDYARISSHYDSMKIQPYYVKMGAAWLLATALSKFPEETRKFVNTCKSLPEDVIRLYVRKARESFRTRDVPAL